MNASTQPHKRNPRVLFFTLLAITLLFALAYIALFLRIDQSYGEVTERIGTIEGKLLRQNTLTSSKTTAVKTVTEREQLDRYVISVDGVVPFLNSLQALGKENRLKVKILSVGIGTAPESSEVFETVKVSLEASGTWQDVYRFTALTERLPLKVDMRRADLQLQEIETDEAARAPRGVSATVFWKSVLDIDVLKLKQL